MYDCLIIGAGPAGLSAAVYLGRFNRSVLVLDSNRGRSCYGQVNENYLGFPEGISSKELRRLGRIQAERFGVTFHEIDLTGIERTSKGFNALCKNNHFSGKTVLLATGVVDTWPIHIGKIESRIGKDLFSCIVCDGYKAQGKKVVCIGNNAKAAVGALQLLRFSRDVTLLVDPNKDQIPRQQYEELRNKNITVGHDAPITFETSEDQLCSLTTENGEKIPAEVIFSFLGVVPNNQLAKTLDLKLDEEGYIVMDEEGYTVVPGVFAAGDITNKYTHQVASAVHAGAEAAQTMNYFLYESFQKVPSDVGRELKLNHRDETTTQL